MSARVRCRAAMASSVAVLAMLLTLALAAPRADDDAAVYWQQRDRFIVTEASMGIGSRINLTLDEQFVDGLLMAAKRKEVAEAFRKDLFPPARHFFRAKADIDRSTVFGIIRKLPKGAVLHGHDTSMASLAYVVGNLTRRDNLFACVNASHDGNDVHQTVPFILRKLRFSTALPEPPDTGNCSWVLVRKLRSQYGDALTDEWFQRQLSLLTTEDPREIYPNIDAVWNAFNHIFSRIDGLLTYKPVFKDYYKQILKELMDDNVMYLELRGTLQQVYDIDGSEWNGADVLQMYKEATDEFLSEHPLDFFGARFIYGPIRHVDNATVAKDMQLVTSLHEKFPSFLAGFDFVGQEDKGRPLKDFAESLMSLPPSLKFFFHAGETDWQGLTDMNLIDAVLLNSSRIGHGYAITKHPLVMEVVKEKGIAIEVNPISNQETTRPYEDDSVNSRERYLCRYLSKVLLLLDDLRNHPAASLLAQDFPVVISCDDPTFWNSSGLSYDFYEAFMGLASVNADLRFLKQLSINSILYSAMEESEKKEAFLMWEKKWNHFIMEIINDFSLNADSLTNRLQTGNLNDRHILREH